jgi:integrase
VVAPLNERRRRLCYPTVNQTFRGLLQKCDIPHNKRIGPRIHDLRHTFRHTSAMHLQRAGNNINMVSYWLGHADINTTHIYVEIDMEMKRKMIATAGAPKVGNKIPWQQPRVLQWLNQLNKKPQVCGLNY